MFLMTTLSYDGAAPEALWIQTLMVVLGTAWLVTLLLLSWKISTTSNPDVKFGCTAGLYACYVAFASVMFVCAIPFAIENLVEQGMVTLADSALWTAGLIALTFAIWNVVGLIGVICWHFTKKRKEMSEMDRMKLEDL